MLLGFYDYTVVLTYISFTSSIIGIFCAVTGHPKWAVFCLALSGLCDMFDGKIARTKKNRTEDEKQFGIQIDSLCDVVCFGVFPIVLCYELGMRRIIIKSYHPSTRSFIHFFCSLTFSFPIVSCATTVNAALISNSA